MFVTKKKHEELKKDLSKVIHINAEIVANNFLLRKQLEELNKKNEQSGDS